MCSVSGTARAEETGSKFLRMASSYQAKSITVAGIEYVPKGSEKAAASPADSPRAKQHRSEVQGSSSGSATSKSLDNFEMRGTEQDWKFR